MLLPPALQERSTKLLLRWPIQSQFPNARRKVFSDVSCVHSVAACRLHIDYMKGDRIREGRHSLKLARSMVRSVNRICGWRLGLLALATRSAAVCATLKSRLCKRQRTRAQTPTRRAMPDIIENAQKCAELLANMRIPPPFGSSLATCSSEATRLANCAGLVSR